MKKVYEAADIHDAEIKKDILTAHGLHATVFGSDIQVLTDLPKAVTAPTVWVADSEYESALEILVDLQKETSAWSKMSWRCRGCSETIEGQFSKCWKCGQNQSE